jgi:acyl-coenzyme A synthetase/AMP-(fatty) acid ligase
VLLAPLDADGGATGVPTTEPGTTGEVLIHAPHMLEGYDRLWRTNAAARLVLGGERWHRTGDVGHLDAGGRLWVEGRLAHVVTTASGVVTPVGVEQRVETLEDVAAAAAVGVGPRGTQALIVVVVPQTRGRGLPGRRRRRMRLADPRLADAVRRAAGTEVSAVLVTGRLPLDIRHSSKVDRLEVAARASATLAGARR